MSDQYTPQRPTTALRTTAIPGSESYNRDVRVEVAPATPTGGGGFSTGMLVAIVFVVVAVMAAVIFSNRDSMGFGSGTTAPDVSIENNVAPAADPPAAISVDPVAPAETAIEPVAPEPAPAPEVAPADPATPAAPVLPTNP